MLVADLITHIRQRTGKTRYSVDASGNPTEGIPQLVVVDFLNEAAAYVQQGIVSSGSTIDDVSEDIDIVAGTHIYQLTDNIHFGNKIRNIQYSHSGEVRDLRDLPQVRDEERRSYLSDSPFGYIRRGRYIELVGIPSRSGPFMRVWFPRQWDEMQLRMGQVTSKTSTTVVLDNDSYYDAVAAGLAQYFCTVDQYGVVQDYDVQVTSFDSGTRTFTIPSQSLNVLAGEFLVPGRFSSSHNDHLPSSLIQQYVKLETQMRMFDQTVSIEAIREDKAMTKRYLAIMEGYQDEILDETDVPISDPFALT